MRPQEYERIEKISIMYAACSVVQRGAEARSRRSFIICGNTEELRIKTNAEINE